MRKTDAVGGGRECPGCVEKNRRLDEAIRLIKRGVKMLNRVGWEPGETDDEWRRTADAFLTAEKMDAEYLRAQNRTERYASGSDKPKNDKPKY